MKAVVIGSTGGIGSALADILAARYEVIGIGRATTPGLDLLDEPSIADTAYRERKERSHALMSLALGGAPVIRHDFNGSAGRLQKDRDQDFWRAVRWRLAGALQRGQNEGVGLR